MIDAFDLNGPLPEASLLLEASAGTGKTYSIAHLFVRLVVERGLAVDQILVVTFTEAATAELRDRVRARLRDAEHALREGAAPDDPPLAAWISNRETTREADAAKLREALLGFDRAAISTIHGFCRRMLLRNTFESGAPFGVELGGEDRALREEVVRDFLAVEVNAREPGRARALRRFAWTSWLNNLARAVADPDVVLLPPADPEADIEGAPHRFTAFLRAELARRKAARHVRGYDDLLRALRDGLTGGPLADALKAAVRAQFAAALIDEFQDTDPVQWAIFRAVFAESGAPLYLIGDPKQAIYSFRGADLHTYLDAREEVAGARALVCNHRSTKRLVEATNALFGGHDDPFGHRRIEYAPVSAARPSTAGPAPLELRFVPRACGERGLPGLVAADLARAIERHGRAGGNAVLVRTRRQARDVQSALRRCGVPCVLRGAQSVFESEEAAATADILAAMHAPGDAAAVKRALVTSLIGADAATILSLDRVEDAWDRWVGRFREWGRLWQSEGFIRAFRRLMAELSLPATLLGRRGGERAVTNVAHLSELLHHAETRRRLDPPALLAWLRRHIEDPGDDDAAQIRLESDADAVEVLTIHGAKGLEFDAVWVPFLLEGRALSKTDREILRCRSDGRRAVHYGTLASKRAALAGAEADARAEASRLLYVAVTRARERCTLYWGALHGRGYASPVARLLFGRDGADFGAVCDRVSGLSDDEMQRELTALASDSIRVTVASRGEVEWRPPQAPIAAPELAALETSRGSLDALWRRTSFSGLTRGELHGPLPVRDVDAEPEDAGDELDVRPETPIALHDFRAGALVGTCLHQILELHDFTEPDDLPGVVTSSMAAHGLDLIDAERVTAALRAAIDTPFDTARLADIHRADRLCELDFTFSVAGGFSPTPKVSRKRLAAVYAAHDRGAQADSIRALHFQPFGGFLTGSIDLVFRRDGRFSLADYKSNFLGPSVADYAPERLAEAMLSRHYFLQAHLYTVALHRYLSYRLPNYDYARHVGAAYYLFLRGMDPDHPPGTGVHVERPCERFVRALSEALD